jgi:hypothetical protein
MTTDTLQDAIKELVDFPFRPDTAAWVEKVKSASTDVIAGTLVLWVTQGGVSYVVDDPIVYCDLPNGLHI